MSGTQRRMARDFKDNSPGVNRSDSEPYARHLPNYMPPGAWMECAEARKGMR